MGVLNCRLVCNGEENEWVTGACIVLREDEAGSKSTAFFDESTYSVCDRRLPSPSQTLEREHLWCVLIICHPAIELSDKVYTRAFQAS